MPTLLDTHAWVWWTAEDARLSKKARAAIRKAQGQEALWVSLISIWELAKKVEKGQIAFDRPIDEWLDAAMAAPGLQWAELTRPVLTESCRLPKPFHGDPADQIIVATARLQGAVVLTRDSRIREYPHVRSIW